VFTGSIHNTEIWIKGLEKQLYMQKIATLEVQATNLNKKSGADLFSLSFSFGNLI